MTANPITLKQTEPYLDQQPGTSGLRKRVTVFQQPRYTENFVQSILSAIPGGPKGATLVLGGDGRYFVKEAIQIVIRLAAGNGVSRLIIGQNGILSTPAASNLIRKMGATGGILLTASHNPGGPDADFGIKYNSQNGGPAPEKITDLIYEYSKKIQSYYFVDVKPVDLEQIGTTVVSDMTVDVVHSVFEYTKLMKSIFDFELIKGLFKARPTFNVLFDGMHGVTGPYAKSIFVEELGVPESSLMNCIPSETFGGGHPDPNLTYAHELVDRVEAGKIDFGAASDGDGDRNMIIGYKTFVNPSDSVAVIAANSHMIPYFKKTGVKGFARSMPTSAALDFVAKKMGVPMFEVPTGWKFFGNLMDADKLSICGEESFGTGSDHIREKDGIWAVLAWLSILANVNKLNPNVSLNDILVSHYETYGRHYFSRYDYEEVDAPSANKMMNHLRSMIEDKSSIIGKPLNGTSYVLSEIDDFKYTDPVDGSVSSKQGIRLLFTNHSRIIFRLSGTGSQGATIRLYVEKYSKEYIQPTNEAISDLIALALSVSNMPDFIGRSEPTVIT